MTVGSTRLAARADLDAASRGTIRWRICALIFAAVVLSYVDRLVLSVLKPTLQARYGWTEQGYGDIVFWFQAAYGLAFLGFGRLIDRIGAKAGYLLAMSIWTVAHMAHALVTSVSRWSASRWRSARRAPIPPRSRPSPTGFPNASVRWPSGSSTRAPMSARSSHRSPCPRSPWRLAGNRPS